MTMPTTSSENRQPRPPKTFRVFFGRPVTGICPGIENGAGRGCCGGAIGTSVGEALSTGSAAGSAGAWLQPSAGSGAGAGRGWELGSPPRPASVSSPISRPKASYLGIAGDPTRSP